MEKSTCLHGIYLLLSILLVTLFIGCDSNKKMEKGNIAGISQNIQNCEEVYPFKEGLALVSQNGKYGFINTQGEIVIPCKYELATDFSEGLAVVKLNGKYGYVDEEGNDTFLKANSDELEYSAIDNAITNLSSERYDLVSCNGKYGIYDKDKTEILPLYYDMIWNTIEDGNNDFFIVELDGKKGVVLKMGTTLIPIEFDNIDYSDGIYHGFFEVEQNGKLGLFDKNGNNIVPCQYDNVQLNQTGYPFGIFVVRQDDKYGCVVNGEERIPCNYYSVIVTENYIITSLDGELNPRRAMDISNKHQVYDNGYRISEDGYSIDDEITRNMDDEYFSSDDNLTNRLLQKEKEIRSAVDELAGN